MSALLWVDGLFAEFCGSLSGALREEARRLSFTLGFAPEPLMPWSQVFAHEVTLAAPWMVAEAMPGLPEQALTHALFAHVLAVIGAMGLDRISDGQVAATPSLGRVLDAAREHRDEHLALAAGTRELPLEPAAVDQDFARTLRDERWMLLEGAPIDFTIYKAVSARKQAPGLLASMALAARMGLAARRCRSLERALLGAALGLQLYDDVLDWEEDAEHGRSWALALSRSPAASPPRLEGEDLERRRASVHRSGVLVRMLRLGRSFFRASARRAGALGALRLSAWAAERAEFLRDLAGHEAHSAGYVHRSRALAAWARAVLTPSQ